MNAAFRRIATPLTCAGVAVVVVAGIAAAYYTGDARLTGTGTAVPFDTSDVLTLNATGTVSTGLYPGGPGADVTVSIANPYPRPVTVTSVVAAGAVTAAPLPGRTCATHAVAVSAPSSGLPLVVGALSSVSVTLTAVATMGTAAESGCQGATFTVPFHLLGQLS